jgi:hypothetical protein
MAFSRQQWLRERASVSHINLRCLSDLQCVQSCCVTPSMCAQHDPFSGCRAALSRPDAVPSLVRFNRVRQHQHGRNSGLDWYGVYRSISLARMRTTTIILAQDRQLYCHIQTKHPPPPRYSLSQLTYVPDRW